MKKKFLLTLVALVCALCCAFGLAACGGNGGEQGHTKEQWESAFDSISKTDYRISLDEFDEQSGDYEPVMTLFCDQPNNAYMSVVYTTVFDDEITYLHKKGDRYYEAHWEDRRAASTAFCGTELITQEQFSQKKDNMIDLFGGTIDNLIVSFRNSYDKFRIVNYADTKEYVCENYPVYATADGSGEPVTTYDRVSVAITSDNKLYWVNIDGVEVKNDEKKHAVAYNAGANIEREVPNDSYNYIKYPEILGSEYMLWDVEVDSNDEAYTQMVAAIRNDIGEMVTCSADGALSGNIEIVGKSISQFTVTDDYGDITVTGPDDITLTGNIGWYDDDGERGMKLTLSLTVPSEGGDVTFTFEFYQQTTYQQTN